MKMAVSELHVNGWDLDMCRERRAGQEGVEHEPRHRVETIRVSKGRWLSMRKHGHRRGAVGTCIATSLCPGGAAGVAVPVRCESLCSRHQANILLSLGAS